MKVKDAIKSCVDAHGNIDAVKAGKIADFLRFKGADYNTVAAIFARNGISEADFENAMYYADMMNP